MPCVTDLSTVQYKEHIGGEKLLWSSLFFFHDFNSGSLYLSQQERLTANKRF